MIKKRKDAELNAAFEDSKEYFDLVELVMHYNCRDCIASCKDCGFYKHFEEQEVIPFDETEDMGNCKFAYRKEVQQ